MHRRRIRVLAMLAALVLGALLPLTSMASGTPVTYEQAELAQYQGDCTTGNVKMIGLGYAQFAGAYTSSGYALTFMQPYGPFPHQVTGVTIYYTGPSMSDPFALLVFTGTLRCDSATVGHINGPVWAACVYDTHTGTTYRGNGAGRDNHMDFNWDALGSYGYNQAQYSGKLKANAQSCDFAFTP